MPRSFTDSDSDSLDFLRNLENSPDLYTGTGRPTLKAATSSRSRLKSFGPAAIITAVLTTFLIIFGAFGSQLGSQLSDVLTSVTDTGYISYTLNSRRITQQILSGERDFPDQYQKRFAKYDATVTPTDSGYELNYANGTVVTGDNFDSVISNDTDFRESFTKAKRGRVANYYDDEAESIYKKLGLTRNIFENYQQTSDSESDTTSYHNTLNKEFSDEADITLNTAEDREVTDEEGNSTTIREASGEDVKSKSLTGDTATTKATSYLATISNRVAKTTDTINIGCAALKVGQLISTALAAQSTYQAIHYYLNNLENVSKTKAGDSNQSAINSFLNFLTEPVTTTYPDVSTGEEHAVTGAPIEAEGMKFTLADEAPDLNYLANFSLARGFLATASALATNNLTTTTCDISQATGAVISLATLATGGSFIKATIGSLVRHVAATTALQLTISGVLAGLIPMLAQTMFQNVAENLAGKPAGELLVTGASAHSSHLARTGSGLAPSDEQTALAYQPAYQTIIAEEAASDHANRSPFDASSPNTFLGALSLKFATLAPANSLATLSSFASIASNSFAALAHAEGEGSSYLTTFGDCPTLSAIGAVGDIYCNPIVTSDLSTVDLSPDDPTYQAVLAPNILTENGQVKIKSGSNLGNYIMFCAERESPFGVYDANIAEAFQTSLGPADNFPYVDNVVDLVNAAEDAVATPWATGSICVNSADNPYWDSEFKYYQHFIEENRILDQMGAFADEHQHNPVAAYREDYYAEHPLDTTRVGTLSRISGLNHDDAELALAFFDYASYLASYKPETTNPFGGEEDTEEPHFMLGSFSQTDQPTFSNAPFDGRPQRGSVRLSAEKSVATDFSDAVLGRGVTKDWLAYLRIRSLA